MVKNFILQLIGRIFLLIVSKLKVFAESANTRVMAIEFLLAYNHVLIMIVKMNVKMIATVAKPVVIKE